jgi:hypothetical protein
VCTVRVRSRTAAFEEEKKLGRVRPGERPLLLIARCRRRRPPILSPDTPRTLPTPLQPALSPNHEAPHPRPGRRPGRHGLCRRRPLGRGRGRRQGRGRVRPRDGRVRVWLPPGRLRGRGHPVRGRRVRRARGRLEGVWMWGGRGAAGVACVVCYGVACWAARAPFGRGVQGSACPRAGVWRAAGGKIGGHAHTGGQPGRSSCRLHCRSGLCGRLALTARREKKTKKTVAICSPPAGRADLTRPLLFLSFPLSIPDAQGEVLVLDVGSLKPAAANIANIANPAQCCDAW